MSIQNQTSGSRVSSEEKRKAYVVGAPRPTDAQALAIPLFTRSGRQVLRVASLNRETCRVSCEIEGTSVEHTYDLADLIHHYGLPGVRIHLRAAGYEVQS